MAEYPPTPPFGVAPGRAVPPYREASLRDMYDYGEAGQPNRRSVLEYHKAQARAAFEHNAKIPSFSPTSVKSGIPPLPLYQDQERLSYGYSTTSNGRDGTLEPPRSPNPYSKLNSNPSLLEVPQPVPHDRSNKHPLSHTPAALNVEEGELSEGEFEEVIPNMNRNSAGISTRPDYYTHQRESHQPAPNHGAFNGNREYEMTYNAPLTDVYGRSLELNRHRSESYSPYEPPNEVEYEPHLAQEVLVPRPRLSYQEDHEPPEVYSLDQRVRQSEYQSGSSRVESLDSPSHNYQEQKSSMPPMDLRSVPHAPALSEIVKSLHDARKEAQNAILNLLPLKVRYRDYLEEGIDEEVVRRQFESLGVPLTGSENPPTKHYTESATESTTTQPYSVMAHNAPNGEPVVPSTQAIQRTRGPGGSSLHSSITLSENASSMTKDSNRSLENVDSLESRKDRIARLLAEKKKQQTSPIAQSQSSVESASLEYSTFNKAATTAQSSAKADKERLLRQKMRALQKSREQRAQKAAAKTATIQPPNKAETALNNTPNITHQLTPDPRHLSEILFPDSTSPAPLLNKQSMPSIPGLFLAAEPSQPQSPADHTMIPSTTQSGMQRKRPVASDFDRPSSTSSSHKRPFGQNKNDQPLVIDVSDDDSDEDDYNEMDVDHPQTTDSGSHLHNSTSTPKIKAIRDLPPLSDFPPRKPFPTPSSTISTPSTTQPPKPSVSKPEDLHRKELEIQEMKKKIAEAERRKRAKQNSSGSQTPRLNEVTSSPARNSGVSLADRIEASVQIGHLIDDASRKVDQDQQKLAEAHAEERAKADDLKKSEAERRRQRRAEIASNLPVVDAEVERARRQLAELRAEMAKIEAAVQKGLDDKRRLAEELDKLGQEADDQLQAQRDRLDGLKLEAGDPEVLKRIDNIHSISRSNTPNVVEESVNASSPVPQSISKPESQQTAQPGAVDDVLEGRPSLSRPQPDGALVGSTEPGHEGRSPNSPQQVLCVEPDKPSADMTPDQALEAALQEATAQADNQSNIGSISDVEMIDSFAPDPEVLAPASAESSSESGQQGDGLIKSSEESTDVADGESDPYEPPEATPPPVDILSSPNSPPFSPAPPEAHSGSSQADKLNDDFLIGPDVKAPSQAVTHKDSPALPSAQPLQDSTVLPSRRTFFSPYESPLKNFRAFRFHPKFELEVQGGFKSITYSNNIKDDKELCRYELAGGVCNDKSCEFQHFRDMGLADDAILVELGNSAGYSEEDKPRFVAGLRTVLQGLRAKKTKDFHVIASEIAAYRARFLGDKSKILLLEETAN